jgi:prepilin signal peptidase PulO-like enzyme (type II secretory pathway)
MLPVFIILTAIAGLFAGGLVNALADDLPQRRRLGVPHYPDDTPRPRIAWLGVLAFLTGHRKSPGGAALSLRYPLAELATSGLMVLSIFSALQNETFYTVVLAFWLVFMAIFVLITVIDVEHRLILFVVMRPAFLLALIYIAVLAVTYESTSLAVDKLIGGAVGFGVFFLLYNGGFLFTYLLGKMRGREIGEVAFGYGDVMLAGFGGLLLGWRYQIIAMFITVFLGAFGALLYLTARRFLGKRYQAFAAIPYGPYIVIATLLMLLFDEQVISLLFGAR